MNTDSPLSSPFALMIAPEDVFRALQQSESLNRLQSRICRPLDRVVPTSVVATVVEADAEIDAEIDAAPDDLAPRATDSEGNTLN